MEPLITEIGTVAVLAGFGGLLRGCIGLYKVMKNPEQGTVKEEFKPKTFGMSVLISGMAGVAGYFLAGLTEPAVLIPLGWAGIDGVEGLFKQKK